MATPTPTSPRSSNTSHCPAYGQAAGSASSTAAPLSARLAGPSSTGTSPRGPPTRTRCLVHRPRRTGPSPPASSSSPSQRRQVTDMPAPQSTSETEQAFAEHGYVVLPDQVPESTLDELRTETSRLLWRLLGRTVATRTVDPR